MTKEKAYEKAQIIDFQGGYTIALVTEIYNDHEAQLKAKAEEIERLKSELKYYKELASDLDDELREAQYELSDLRR